METVEIKTTRLSEHLSVLTDAYKSVARSEIKTKLKWTRQMLSDRERKGPELTYSEDMTVQKIVKKLLKAQNTTV